MIGLYERDSTKNNSKKLMIFFNSLEELANSLLRNWCGQWFYKNRKLLGCQDYKDICKLDNEILNLPQKGYRQSIQILQK